MEILNMNNADKMYTFLRGYCEGKGYEESLQALPFARSTHEGQVRKSGEPYIVHPLGVALYGINIGLDEDDFIATCLLHDTVEDCDVDLDDLPVNDEVRRNIALLTFRKNELLAKKAALALYYSKISESEIATFVKLLDRYNNLSTMTTIFTLPKIIEYTDETIEFAYPLMEEAKARYPMKRNPLYILKHNIYSLVNTTEGMLEFMGEDIKGKGRTRTIRRGMAKKTTFPGMQQVI